MSFSIDSKTIDNKIDSYILNAFFITGLEKIPLDALMKIIMLEAKKDNFSIKYTNKQQKEKYRNIHYYIHKMYGSLTNYITKNTNYSIKKDTISYIEISSN